MGKIRQKNHKEEEHLLGEIRKLKSENRNLRKRLKQLERYPNNNYEKEERIKEKVSICNNCGKGELKEIIVVGRKIVKCELCDYRSKATKI